MLSVICHHSLKHKSPWRLSSRIVSWEKICNTINQHGVPIIQMSLLIKIIVINHSDKKEKEQLFSLSHSLLLSPVFLPSDIKSFLRFRIVLKNQPLASFLCLFSFKSWKKNSSGKWHFLSELIAQPFNSNISIHELRGDYICVLCFMDLELW